MWLIRLSDGLFYRATRRPSRIDLATRFSSEAAATEQLSVLQHRATGDRYRGATVIDASADQATNRVT